MVLLVFSNFLEEKPFSYKLCLKGDAYENTNNFSKNEDINR